MLSSARSSGTGSSDAGSSDTGPSGARSSGGVARRRVALVALATVVGLTATAASATITENARPAASQFEAAERIVPDVFDAVSVYTRGELPVDIMNRAIAATQAAGGTFAIASGVSIPLRGVYRGESVVQQPPSGYSYPMSLTALPQQAIGQTISFDVSAVLDSQTLVMGQRSADMRGAQEGDVVDLLASNGSTQRFTIGAVFSDDVLGGTEILMTSEAAARLGLTRRSSILLWGFSSRQAITDALADEDLVSTSIRIRRSWDPRNPDSGLSMSRTKQLLGEFAYRVFSNGSVGVDSEWSEASLPDNRVVLNETIRIRARCHVVIEPAIRAALAEVEAAGLGSTINVVDANRAGGCFYARFNRLTPDSSIGFLSRHSWGMALDTNTVGSCQGCAPPDMNCDVVRIFRKHGFAWGGNYLVPDGMHFEYVGEPRHELPYPSRFCPNDAGSTFEAGAASSTLALSDTERSQLFADIGFDLDPAHQHGGGDT